MPQSQLCNFLRGELAKRRITQRGLAKKFRIAESYVSRMLCNDCWIRGDFLDFLFEILDLDPDMMGRMFLGDFRWPAYWTPKKREDVND